MNNGPVLFFEAISAHQRSYALKAGLELGVFNALGQSRLSADQVAAAVSASPRGIRTLCDFLTTAGFLTKSPEGYALGEEAAVFLDPHSPAYLGGAADFMLSDHLLGMFAGMTAAVRRGGAEPHEESVTVENPIWVKFARGMGPVMGMIAEQLPGFVKGTPTRVLDVAAGHGMFGIAMARHFPSAEVTALDWAPVLEVAKENASRAGVELRYLPGDAFEKDLGGPYDLVLVTNFLHHFDRGKCVEFLGKVRAATAPGGQVITVEFIPDEDRVSPPQQANFSMTMLVSTTSGDAYTFAELQSMYALAGFPNSELHRLQPMGDVVVSS